MPTLEQIQVKMKKLQAQADALIAKKSSAVVEKIRELMSTHGLTTADIDAHAGGKKSAKKSGAKSETVAKTSTAKYQDPKTGATWTGHGRAPSWIANAKDRNKFLILDGAEAPVATTSSTISKTKTAVKKASSSVGATAGNGQPKGPQAAKYRDPKSGKTWSGRGPAPAWLAAAKDRTKFLIDGAGAYAAVTKTSTPKADARKATAKNVVAKKAPAAKKIIASKKAPAKKVPVKRPAASKKVAAKVDAAIAAPGITVAEAGA
ncbi:hypothetical protein LMG28614_04190 [Paraburkholderia ultramafica]|uniref:DNA-binding protein H-NS-like C-terminal domain-containing protein n=1 Tax=Paraburkholderia ultramafica TaxID=1544867 RepID=A0A6S7BEB6_9BURK|nr:H-NS family nucleoid-associated regulatory protein [Paraburkholderia ultramafica]CAB3795511.1 hypothetical protein LMG28614_04190 [Paraburkholderia ultramafica]